MVGATRIGRINAKALIVLCVSVALILFGFGVFQGHDYRVKAMAQKLLTQGRQAYEEGRYEDARTHFGRYLQKYPTGDADALKLYAEANLAAKPLEPQNLSAAVGAYRRLLMFYNDHPDEAAAMLDARRQLARLYEYVGSFTDLEYISTEQLDVCHDDTEAMLWLAKSFIGRRQFAEARGVLNEITTLLQDKLRANDDYVKACILLSLIASTDAARIDEQRVLAPLNAAIEYDPESVDALLQRAETSRRLAELMWGDERRRMLQAAVSDLENAEKLTPRRPLHQLRLAEAWLQHDEYDRAAKHLNAIESPDDAALAVDFVDVDDWTAGLYLVAATNAMRLSDAVTAVKLTDGVMTQLTKPTQRKRITPLAIQIYATTGAPAEARRALDEYLKEAQAVDLTPEQESHQRRLTAIVAMAEGDPFETIQLLEPSAANSVGGAAVQKLLSEAYIQADMPGRAAAMLSRRVINAAPNADAYKKLIRQLLRQRDWQRAIATARQAEQEYQGDSEMVLLRLEARIRSGEPLGRDEYAGIEAELKALIESRPEESAYRTCLAFLQANMNRPETAEETLECAVEECRDPMPAMLDLAVLYAATGREDQAVQYGRAICEQYASHAASWMSLARIMSAESRYEEACEVLRTGAAATADDEHRAVIRMLCELQTRYGDRAAGIELLQQCATRWPQDAQIRCMLLDLPEIARDAATAEKLIQELKEIEHGVGSHWRFYQARQLLTHPDWRLQRQEIEALLRYCIECDRSWAAPALALGGMYEQIGREQDAVRIYKNAAQSTLTPAVTDHLVRLLQQQGRYDDARAALNELRRATHANVLANRSIGLAVQSGDLDGAVRELQRKTAVEPSAEDLATLARLSYLRDGDAAMALGYLDRAEELDGASTPVLAARLYILKEAGRLEEARRLIADRTAAGGDVNLHLLAAAFYRWIGDENQAERVYAQVAQDDEDGRGYWLQGRYYAQANRLDEALAVWERGLIQHPGDSAIRRDVVTVLLTRDAPGDRARAAAMLRELVNETPEDADLLRASGALAYAEDDVRQACVFLKQAIAADPDSPEAYVQLIPILLDQGETAEAHEYAEQALLRRPGDARLSATRAAVELSMDNLPEARRFAGAALEQDPDDAMAADLTAEIAMRTGDVELLLSVRDRIARLAEQQPRNARLQTAALVIQAVEGRLSDSSNGESPVHLAAAARTLAAMDGERFYTDACRMYERAMELAPGDVTAYEGLATLAYSRGDPLRAISTYRAALQVEPTRAEVLNNLAWILAETYPDDGARLAEALNYADRAVRLRPNDANMRDTLGFVLSRTPDRESEARDAFAAALEMSDADSPAQSRILLRLLRVCAAIGDEECIERRATQAEQFIIAGAYTTTEREEIRRLTSLSGAAR